MKLHLLYTAVWMLGLSLTKEKKRLSDILFGSLFSAVLQIMYRTFPIRAYADRENAALLPTERIRQKQRCRKRFSVACGIKSFNRLSWQSGFGGHKRRKGEICFWKIFCRNRASETAFCSFAYLYGKKRQNVTKKPFVLQKIHKTHASIDHKKRADALRRPPVSKGRTYSNILIIHQVRQKYLIDAWIKYTKFTRYTQSVFSK